MEFEAQTRMWSNVCINNLGRSNLKPKPDFDEIYNLLNKKCAPIIRAEK